MKSYSDLSIEEKEFYDTIIQLTSDIIKKNSHRNSRSSAAGQIEEAIRDYARCQPVLLSQDEVNDILNVAKAIYYLAVVAEQVDELLGRVARMATYKLKNLFLGEISKEVREKVRKAMQGMTDDQEIAFVIFCIKDLSAKCVLTWDSDMNIEVAGKVQEAMALWNTRVNKWLVKKFSSEEEEDIIKYLRETSIRQVYIDRKCNTEVNREFDHPYHHFDFLIDAIIEAIKSKTSCFIDQNPRSPTQVRLLISNFLKEKIKCKIDWFDSDKGPQIFAAMENISECFPEIDLEKLATVARRVLKE